MSPGLLERLLRHFDLLAIGASLIGLGAVAGAGALVVRLFGGIDGWAGLVVGLLLLAASLIIGHYMLVTLARQRLHARIADIREAAHELGGGDLSVEMPEGDDDLGELGASLNTMRARVARLLTAQRELLSGVSHELRSPLARIEVALELIDMELQSDGEHELIVSIREEVALLNAHISRLLEAQRVSKDRVVLSRKPLVIDDLLAGVIDRERLRLDKLGWRLEVSLGAPEVEVHGDDNALDRVLSTLIENAIRHASSPGPEAAYSGSFEAVSEEAAEPEQADGEDQRASAAEPDADAWRPSLRVETEASESSVTLRFMDRGPGLDEEQCTRVFEPFFRGDRSRSTETGGTGLGMYLTRNILRAHGGDVLARPRDGGGLVVELQLPIRGTKEVQETMRVQWSDVREEGPDAG